MSLRIGIGHDTHRLGAQRPLVLAGIEVAHPSGLVGHSDADVVLHAVIDALLGAFAQGDIGDWFPDTDPRWAGADSRALLAQVIDQVVRPRGRIQNLDCIVFAQQPKLGPRKRDMQASLAEMLALPLDSVNVKAKTGEHVGPVGRGEAISAEVVVLVDVDDAHG